MSEHLSDFNKILVDLQNLDAVIEDEDEALLLLNSLPNTYEHLTTTLLYGKDEIKFDDVSNALINNEHQKKNKQVQRDSTLEALTVRGKSDNKKSSRWGKSCSKTRGASSDRKILEKDECAFFHRKGHWKKDCPKLQNKDKKNSTTNVACVEDDDSEFSLIGSSLVCHFDEWVLDLGYTYHMCLQKGLVFKL